MLKVKPYISLVGDFSPTTLGIGIWNDALRSVIPWSLFDWPSIKRVCRYSAISCEDCRPLGSSGQGCSPLPAVGVSFLMSSIELYLAPLQIPFCVKVGQKKQQINTDER